MPPTSTKVPASLLRVGDVIEMYGFGWNREWVPIKTILASKSGATLYFHGPLVSTERMRLFDRTCRATTRVEVRS